MICHEVQARILGFIDHAHTTPDLLDDPPLGAHLARTRQVNEGRKPRYLSLQNSRNLIGLVIMTESQADSPT